MPYGAPRLPRVTALHAADRAAAPLAWTRVIVTFKQDSLLDHGWLSSRAIGHELYCGRRDRYASVVEMHVIHIHKALILHDVVLANEIRPRYSPFEAFMIPTRRSDSRCTCRHDAGPPPLRPVKARAALRGAARFSQIQRPSSTRRTCIAEVPAPPHGQPIKSAAYELFSSFALRPVAPSGAYN